VLIGALSEREARENFKSHVDAAQIEAWVDCKGAWTQLAAYFIDVDSDGATLVLVWKAPPSVGRLKIVEVDFPADTSFALAMSKHAKPASKRPSGTPQPNISPTGTPNGSLRSSMCSIRVRPRRR
jgi:hypothetical protein